MPSEDQLIHFTKQRVSSRREITLTSDLVTDLKIDGDDADEFIHDLKQEFPRWDPTVDWSVHFHSEGELLSPLYLWKLLVHKLGLRNSPPMRQLVPFTLRDLLELQENVPGDV